jgi:hypothetical protein
VQFPVMHFTFQRRKEGPRSHLIKKDDLDVDCSASKENTAMCRERQSPP